MFLEYTSCGYTTVFKLCINMETTLKKDETFKTYHIKEG